MRLARWWRVIFDRLPLRRKVSRDLSACFPDITLIIYAGNGFAADRRREIETHLRDCMHCRAFIEERQERLTR